ncbi:hypothetical protein FCM35_KLT05670 [Carex littledalei]|uniref:Uncharacterized protein n=1 Tax=Carex littledalei TaxID=544730 RepID=A0A833QYC5_9POAL|nr:hypothetical protein FCM35_KLT05670 [Carex littledalei]
MGPTFIETLEILRTFFFFPKKESSNLVSPSSYSSRIFRRVLLLTLSSQESQCISRIRRTLKKPKNRCHTAVMEQHRSNGSFDLDEERATKRTRASGKDRVGSAMERAEKEDIMHARHGRVVDLKEITNSWHGISGGERYKEGKERVSKRYKEERGYERTQNSRDKENKKPRDTSVREPVGRSREHSSYKESSGTDRYRYEKENSATDRYRNGKYQDQRPKRKHQDSSSYEHERYTHKHWYNDEKRCNKYWDGFEREKHDNREDHKYVDERKSAKCGGEDCRGEKRLYADNGNSGDLKGTNLKAMRGELDKHVPRHCHRKDEYLSSDNFQKRVSNSGAKLIKGKSRNNNLREQEKKEEDTHKVLSPIPERSNSPFRSQNDRTNTYPSKTLEIFPAMVPRNHG